MLLEAGTKLGPYEILGSLGAGGMGEVYRARDASLKRDVAIKVMPGYVAQSPDRIRRFEQEAHAAAALNHPNILAVFQFGSYEGAPYLVSELLEGSTLREALERGPLPVRKAIDYGVQIARGLAAAHEKGIIHRDLKPENLFVTRDGRMKILDFGLAKLMGGPRAGDSSDATMTNATDPGTVLGTVGYMSPEQVRGQPVDHRTDLFAFGAILYEMLTGRRAFAKGTSAETMTAILNEEPQAISQVTAASPPGLQRVVHRCLEKNPEQRFQSASDLAFALESLSDSGTGSGVGLAAPPMSRHRPSALWAVSSIAVLAIVALIGVLVFRPGRSGVLHVVSYTQITHDGRTKYLEGTDGTRLYFAEGFPSESIGQIAISGGETVPLPVKIPNPGLLDVSPDGSTLLVQNYTGGLMHDYPTWSVRTLGGSEHLLGSSYTATFSADGSEVVYSTHSGDLHIVSADGSGDRTLASTGTLADDLSWSPDGRTIRYTEEGTFAHPAPVDTIWEISVSGGQPHPVFPGFAGDQHGGCWAQDGSFYFISGGQIWGVSGHRGLFGGGPPKPQQITFGPVHWRTPVPGRDGRTIYAAGLTDRGELVRYDAHAGHMHPYLGGVSADGVSFSRDGKSVAYVSYPDGILWKANGDGSEPMQLTDGSQYPRTVSMSPDGAQIVFQAPDPHTGTPRGWIVSAEGGAPRLLLPEAKGPESDVHWSPDGRRVVFAASPEVGGDPQSELRILDLGSGQVTTVPGSAGMYSAHWSPDGRWLVALPYDSLGLNLYDFTTQKWSTIYHRVTGFDTWSKDSQWIYFLDFQDHRGVYRIRVTGGDPERIVDLANFAWTGYFHIWMGLDPNDAPLLLRDIGTDDVFGLTLEKD